MIDAKFTVQRLALTLYGVLTINPGKDADAIPLELSRPVQVYLDPSGTGGTFEGAILPDR
jgi:hypothetical protein